MPRLPKDYDGVKLTTRKMSDVLPVVVSHIAAIYQKRPDLILAAWPDVIGEHLAPMTQAIGFQEGVLTVKVKNSTLYSLLVRKEAPVLLKRLRQKFPHTPIHQLVFRMS